MYIERTDSKMCLTSEFVRKISINLKKRLLLEAIVQGSLKNDQNSQKVEFHARSILYTL